MNLHSLSYTVWLYRAASIAFIICGAMGASADAADSMLMRVVDINGYIHPGCFEFLPDEFKGTFTTHSLLNALKADGIEVPETIGYSRFLPFEFKGQFTTSNLMAAIKSDGITIPISDFEIGSLNTLLVGPSLYSRFPHVSLRKEAKDLLTRETALTPEEHEALNRLILEAAYPQLCPRKEAATGIESLNRLLRETRVIEMGARVSLPKEGVELMKQVLRQNENGHIQLARLILEAAYPKQCPKNANWVTPDSILHLASILDSQGIRVCLETVSQAPHGNNFPIRVSITKAPVKDILDEVCRKYSYAYEEHDGFINLFPTETVTSHLKDYPLNQRVVHLKLVNTGIHDAINTLGTMVGSHMRFLNMSIIHGVTDNARVPSLEVCNMTVREVLNRIVKMAGLRSWSCTIDPQWQEVIYFIR